MAFFRCKSCGGDLDISSGKKVVVCDFCGNQQTIPSADDEKKVNLFNRANNMRLHCEFDKANAIYENIVSEFPNEAEAYWGLCLCKYGIEYVDDPKTKKKVPTLHRASKRSIFDDDDYKKVIDRADVIARDQYKLEAAEIDRLNAEINEISSKEKPYDVFICYKETDADGERTKDSIRAQEIYDVLTQKGYKVFFARITLEDKLGEKYEPYIFSALNSAKVMLVIGTKPEHFNAVWVKNEWSRFLDIIEHDTSKKLFPCYSNMDPYDLPLDFKNLQAQDMSKIGFEQDLARNIGKIIPRETPGSAAAAPAVTSESLDVLVPNAKRMMELKNYPAADKLYTKITEIYPDKYEGWWGKILCLTEGLTVFKPEADNDFELYYNTLVQVVDEDTLLDIDAQLRVYFKNVIAVKMADYDIDHWNESLAKSEEMEEELAEEKSKESRNASIYKQKCEDEIHEYEEQQSSASKQFYLFDNLCTVRQKTITLTTIMMVCMCVLLIPLIGTGCAACSAIIGGDESAATGFFIFFAIAIAVTQIVFFASNANAKGTFSRAGITLGSAEYGGLRSPTLQNYIEQQRYDAETELKNCGKEIDRIREEIENNDAVAGRNIRDINLEIHNQAKYTDRLKAVLELSDDTIVDFWYLESCRKYKIPGPKMDPETLDIIFYGNNAADLINDETDEEYVPGDYDNFFGLREYEDDDGFVEDGEYEENGEYEEDDEIPEADSAVNENIAVNTAVGSANENAAVSSPANETAAVNSPANENAAVSSPANETIEKASEDAADSSTNPGFAFCPACGVKLVPGMKFCGICGCNLSEMMHL